MVNEIYNYVIMGLESNDCFVIDALFTNGVTATALLIAWVTQG
jgi:hypothetical protein